MNELIKLNETEIDDETVQTVNARELHQFLEVGKVFAAWIRSRLDTLGSIEGQDYIVLSGESLLSQIGRQTEEGNKPRGGHNRLEYFVTLDTAKHLAMMERNDLGFRVRQYFIEVEKAQKNYDLKDKLLLSVFKAGNDIEKAEAINAYETKYVQPLEKLVIQQAIEIEESKPKLRYHDIVLSCPDLLTVTQISQDYTISNQKINKILASKGVQYKDKSGVWCIYAKYGMNQYAQTFTHTYQDNDGNYHSKLHLKWTQKGRLFIYELLKEEGILPICEQEK